MSLPGHPDAEKLADLIQSHRGLRVSLPGLTVVPPPPGSLEAHFCEADRRKRQALVEQVRAIFTPPTPAGSVLELGEDGELGADGDHLFLDGRELIHENGTSRVGGGTLKSGKRPLLLRENPSQPVRYLLWLCLTSCGKRRKQPNVTANARSAVAQVLTDGLLAGAGRDRRLTRRVEFGPRLQERLEQLGLV